MPPNDDTELISDRPLNIDLNVFGRGLVMASLNINSLLAHIDELRVYMNTSKIDVLTINETKLDSTIENSEIYLPGFEIIRKDRTVNGRNGGGVCIYLRTNINYIMRDDLSSDNLECLIIEITKPRSKSLLLGTWYRPPNSPTSHLNDFENIIGKIDSENQELCILGDINIDLMQEPISANASKLNSILDVYGMDQLITEPTRITNNSRSLIDLCLTNIPSKIINSGVNHI